jgi:hypothetical protein
LTACDYYPDSTDQDGMHSHGWHSWIGYGNVSIGNLGMHIMDVAFWAHNDWTHGGIGLRLRF